MNIKDSIPRKIAAAGGIFITLSGILNLVLGIQIGALHYYPYPGGKMGHVGITAGLAAILIGVLITFVLPLLYKHQDKEVANLGRVVNCNPRTCGRCVRGFICWNSRGDPVLCGRDLAADQVLSSS